MAGSLNTSNTEKVKGARRRASILLKNSPIKLENEENQSSTKRKRRIALANMSQTSVQPRKKQKPLIFYPARPTYEMMKKELSRIWRNKYVKFPENEQDKSIVDLEIDVEVTTRSAEGHDHWDRLTREMGEKNDYEVDYIICMTSRKLGGPLSDLLLIKWSRYPRPTWEATDTMSAGFELEMCENRKVDLDFVELKLRTILGDDVFERLFPNRYLLYEAGRGMGGYVQDKKSIYKNVLRSIEWRWNYVNRRSGQPLIYVEDWTTEPEDAESLTKFLYTNFLSNSTGVNKILEQHNKQLDHKKCGGGHCATCMVQSKQGKEHSHCCGMKYTVGFDKDGTMKWDDKGFLAEQIDVNFECTSECACGANCKNKTLKNGRQFVLCVFREPGKGWGVRTVQELPSCSFVTEYTGEMRLKELPYSDPKWIYDFQLNFHVRDVTGKKIHSPLVISAGEKGNESRFFNHSCEPNMRGITFILERHGIWYNHMGFFTTKKIQAGEELTFDYHPHRDGNSPGPRMFEVCRCLSDKCRFKTPRKRNEVTIEEENEDEDNEVFEVFDEEDEEKSLVGSRVSSPIRQRSNNTKENKKYVKKEMNEHESDEEENEEEE